MYLGLVPNTNNSELALSQGLFPEAPPALPSPPSYPKLDDAHAPLALAFFSPCEPACCECRLHATVLQLDRLATVFLRKFCCVWSPGKLKGEFLPLLSSAASGQFSQVSVGVFYCLPVTSLVDFPFRHSCKPKESVLLTSPAGYCAIDDQWSPFLIPVGVGTVGSFSSWVYSHLVTLVHIALKGFCEEKIIKIKGFCGPFPVSPDRP